MYLEKIDDRRINEISKNDLIDDIELNNDILIRKVLLGEKNFIFVKEDQFVVFYGFGKILDIANEKGLYEVKEGESKKDLSSWNFIIQKAEDESNGVLFVNVSEIKNNKFYMKNLINYTDWTYEEEPFESKIRVQGVFNFKIIKPENFIKIVIGLRDHYSKPELLEQIRVFILKSIEEGIKELSEIHKVDIKTLVNNIHELKIKVNQNFYDEKLLSKGIKLTFFDIDKFELDEETKKMLEIEEKYNNN